MLKLGSNKLENLKVIVLVAIALILSVVGVVASNHYYKQQKQNKQDLQAKEYTAKLFDLISKDEETIKSITSSTLKPESDFALISNQLFEVFKFAERIELRTEDGHLIKAKNRSSDPTLINKTYGVNPTPSVQLSLMKAVQLSKTFWSRSYALNGEPLVNIIQPTGNKGLVWVILQSQRRWAPTDSGIQTQTPFALQILDVSQAKSKVLLSSQSVQNLTLAGLELNLIFTPLDTPSNLAFFDTTSVSIGVLGFILCLLLIKSFLDTKRNRIANETIERQSVALQKQSELNSFAEISTTIAHELNQPLGAISNYLTLCELILKQKGLDEPKVFDALEKAKAQSLRAGEVIKWIRRVVNQQPQEKTNISVKPLIDNLTPYLQTLCQKHFSKLEVECWELKDFKAVPILMELVIVNLVKNGLEAMGNTPEHLRKIHLRVYTVTSKLDSLELANSLDSVDPMHPKIRISGELLRIDVQDTGTGVSKEFSSSLFGTFFTTKSQGMGVGLSLCKTVAESLGGQVLWSNNEYLGATFSMLLPL